MSLDFRWVATDEKQDLLSPEGDFPRLTYWPQNWKSLSALGLFDLAWSTLGNSLFYMYFLQAPWDKEQETRVARLCHRLATEGHARRFPDSPENREWFQAFLIEVGDEVENQC